MKNILTFLGIAAISSSLFLATPPVLADSPTTKPAAESAKADKDDNDKFPPQAVVDAARKSFVVV